MSVIEDSQTLKASVEQQLRFERLLTEFSTTFISLPAREVDKAIDHAQQRLVEFFGVVAVRCGRFLKTERTFALRMPGRRRGWIFKRRLSLKWPLPG